MRKPTVIIMNDEDQILYRGTLYTIYRDCSKGIKVEYIKKYKGEVKGPIDPRGDCEFNAYFISDDESSTIKRTELKFLDINDPDSCVLYSDNLFLMEEDDDLARNFFISKANEDASILYDRFISAENKYKNAVDKIKFYRNIEIKEA